MSNKIRMNRTWEEFKKLPKVKQIFTPWFIAALLVFIICGSVAFAMAGLLNEGFQTARFEVSNEMHHLDTALDINGVKVSSYMGLKDFAYNHANKDSLSLMAWLGYDPHASYQSLYKTINNVLVANPNLTIDTLLASSQQDLAQYVNNDANAAKSLFEALHYHAHSTVINHNGTWGFVVKVLGDGTNSWFYKFLELFAKSSTTHASGHGDVSVAEKLQTILYYNNANYNAYYWVFIVFMMPQMISTIIIVVKLITTLAPKKSKEEKLAYKLEKEKAKLLKKHKVNSQPVVVNQELDQDALGAN